MPSTGEGEHVVAAQSLLAKIESIILFPLMALMMAVALLVFIWGAYEYVLHADSEEGRSKGQRHMLTGIIGLLIMISAYGILNIATGTFGIGASSSNGGPVSCGTPGARADTCIPTGGIPPSSNGLRSCGTPGADPDTCIPTG